MTSMTEMMPMTATSFTEDNDIPSIVDQCVDNILQLVSLSVANDRSHHCLIHESDDEVVSEVKDLVDYMLELVSTAVPQSVPKSVAINGLNGNMSEDEDDIQIIEMERSDDKTYEVIDLTDNQSENCDYCLVCGQNKEIRFQVKHNNKIRSCCSFDCVRTLQSNSCCANCSTFISDGMQGFRANFGGNVILCSDECLQKSEVERQPNTHCFSCRKLLSKDKSILFWQTMEFCSTDCVQSKQMLFGSKCALCQTSVNRQSLGKYSVRFGDIIKQFCIGSCLETYKKTLKVCAFCQKDLKLCENICIATFGFGQKTRLREFCDQICKAHYGLMISSRYASQVECSICQRSTDSKTVIECTHQKQKYLMCSTTCAAAFKYNYNLRAIFCDNCHKYGWSKTTRATIHVLHFSGMTRIFCTRKCLSMYVLKNRQIVACVCCKVKKYNFDLIERFDSSQNDSKLFCSLNCLSLYDIAEEEKKGKSAVTEFCRQCNTYSTPQFFLKIDDLIHNFCSYQCVFQHQRHFLPDSLIAVDNHMIGNNTENDWNSHNVAIQQNHMWTPSFFGQQKAPLDKTKTKPNILKIAPQTVPSSALNKQSIPPQIMTSTASSVVSIQNAGALTQTSSATTTTQIIKEIIKETKEVIVKVPTAKVVKNKCTQFRPPSQTKGTSCRPFQMDEEVQTDPQPKIICPILLPIPIFVPIPVSYMQPLAIPLPLPVPFFLKPDPPSPPKPDPPIIENNSNLLNSSIDSINLTDIQIGEMQELMARNNDNNSTSKRKSQNESEGTTSKRGRRQSDGISRGRGGRGRGRGRGGRGRGRGRGRRREEWEMSSEEEEEEPPIESSEEEEEEQNESSNNSEDVMQTQQLANDLQQLHYNPNQSSETTARVVVSTPRGRGRSRATADTSTDPKRRGRKKKESIETNVVTNDVIESELSTNTINAGINALRIWLRQSPNYYQTKNILELHQNYLSEIFCKFVEEICQVHGQDYSPDYIYMLCLDLQKHLTQNNRLDNIFMDPSYKQFIYAIHRRLQECNVQLSCIQEESLWDCGQLGAHSPTVLLNTVMYLATKFFQMTQLEDHTMFSFNNLNKEWTNDSMQRLIYQSTPKRGRKRKTLTLYENQENPLRCPVKLFEFYLSKCPENVIQRKDMFYLYPIEGCVPDSQTWYTSNALTNASMDKMLQRILVVREIVSISSSVNH